MSVRTKLPALAAGLFSFLKQGRGGEGLGSSCPPTADSIRVGSAPRDPQRTGILKGQWPQYAELNPLNFLKSHVSETLHHSFYD